MSLTPVCTIDATGIHKPDFATVLAYFQNGYRALYGADTYLGNDSQDGQFIGLLAKAVDDVNAQSVADYNAYSPATAQGVGLSSVVRINNLLRKVPTLSSVTFTLVGQAGASIANGEITDGLNDGITWLLPQLIVIPFTGQIDVTAVASALGAITLAAGTVNTQAALGNIVNPQPGWQGAYNANAASVGQAVESDAELRARQRLSTSIPAKTTLEALRAVLLALAGVTYCAIYENDTDAIDAKGIPGHSISVVISGGDDGQIAQLIYLKKGICGTYGTSIQAVTDSAGVNHNIRFYRPKQVLISVALSLTTLPGFTLAAQNAAAAAVAAYITLLQAATIYRLSVLTALGNSTAYAVEEVLISRDGLAPTANDVQMAFYEQPICTPAYVTFPGLPAL